MFITLEGADGTGKTTLSHLLAKKLGGIAYTTPPPNYSALREEIDRDASPEEQYDFYRNGIDAASEEISTLLSMNNKVIADRYWLTTYTYHQIKGVNVSRDDFQSIVMPELTIILSLNKNVQAKRMLQRGLSIEDTRMLNKQHEVAIAFYCNVLDSNTPFIIIDTQKFSPENCVEIVLNALKL